MSTNKLFIAIWIAFVWLLAGCETGGTTIHLDRKNPPVEKPSFQQAHYVNLFWHPQKGLLVTVEDSAYRIQDYYYVEGKSESIPFALPDDSLCDKYLIYQPIRLLSDGRMGMIKSCGTKAAEPDSSASHLLAYDLESQELKQIVANKLPHPDAPYDFSWNPTMTQGVQELTDRLFSTLYWISPEGSSPIPLTLSYGKRSWSLEEQYYNMTTSNEGGSQFGFAGYPAWSPDGKVIAFWASFDAMGRKGVGRADGEFFLVFLDPATLSYQFILRNIYGPDALAWSPNGKRLAFYGDVGTARERGLWIFSPASNTLVKIGNSERFEGIPAWSPDSNAIAVISCSEVLCPDAEILKYNLQGILP